MAEEVGFAVGLETLTDPRAFVRECLAIRTARYVIGEQDCICVLLPVGPMSAARMARVVALYEKYRRRGKRRRVTA